MTLARVPNSTSIPQSAYPFSSQTPFGRRAFGRQRPTSQAERVRHIVYSITTHRELGQNCSASFYTHVARRQGLVQDRLDTFVVTTDEVAQPLATPPDVLRSA